MTLLGSFKSTLKFGGGGDSRLFCFFALFFWVRFGFGFGFGLGVVDVVVVVVVGIRWVGCLSCVILEGGFGFCFIGRFDFAVFGIPTFRVGWRRTGAAAGVF